MWRWSNLKTTVLPQLPSLTALILRFELFVHIADLAADERLVSLDFTRQFFEGKDTHRMTNTMQHEPCRSLRHFQDLLKAHSY